MTILKNLVKTVGFDDKHIYVCNKCSVPTIATLSHIYKCVDWENIDRENDLGKKVRQTILTLKHLKKRVILPNDTEMYAIRAAIVQEAARILDIVRDMGIVTR